VAELKGLGFRNVRVDDFTIPFWSRVRESARVVSPAPQNLEITMLGGSRPTPEGGLTAQIVRFTSMAELDAAAPSKVAGKIVFVDEGMTRIARQ